MKKYFFYFFAIIILYSCDNKKEKSVLESVKISENLYFTKNSNGIDIKSYGKNFSLDKSMLPMKKIVLLNSSLIGYFEELNQIDKIVGVVSPEFIFNSSIHKNIANGNIHVVGNMQKIDVEKIIALSPDAVFTNYISVHENVYYILKSYGIETVFIDEYREEIPLQKAAYIRLFGVLLGKEKLAENKYTSIEKKYNTLKNKISSIENKPIVIANEIYGNVWYMPGGKSMLSTIISDAGGKYILENNTEKGSVALSFEEVLSISKKANVWVNAGSYSSKKEMLSVRPQYKIMPIFENGEIYSLQKSQKGSANNIFEQGNVRVDLLLRDYITVLHPKVFAKDSLTYLQKLE